MIPDKIEIDLAALKESENLDRLAHINMLLRQILYSQEVTPSMTADGEWPQDFDWVLDTNAVTMRQIEGPPPLPRAKSSRRYIHS